MLSLLLQQSAKLFQLDSCAFWILSTDKSRLESRSAFNCAGEATTARRTITLALRQNLFTLLFKQIQPLLLKDSLQPQWRPFLDQQTEQLLQGGSVALVAVRIHDKVIGAISAQRFKAKSPIDEDDFQQFCFICDHLNMCMSLTAAR